MRDMGMEQLTGVIGCVHIQTSSQYVWVLVVEKANHLADSLYIPGEHSTLRAVLTGRHDAVIQVFRHSISAEAYSHHSPRYGVTFCCLTSIICNGNGYISSYRVSSVRSGNLAAGMTNHLCGSDTPLSKQIDQTELNCDTQGLGKLGLSKQRRIVKSTYRF